MKTPKNCVAVILFMNILGSFSSSFHSVKADHDTMWTCNYYKMQGLCDSPRGSILDMWRDMDRYECERRCNERDDCWSYLYAEGDQHIYSGTCEFYDGSPWSADGNGGWSCYVKQDCYGGQDDTNNNDDTHWHFEWSWEWGNDTSSNDTFEYKGPYMCYVPWLDCSRELSSKEVITSQWEFWMLTLQCWTSVGGLFLLELSDIIKFYTDCKQLDTKEEQGECAAEVFASDYNWCTDY